MVLHISVKVGQRQDRLWRQGNGLLVHLMSTEEGKAVNSHLVRYLGERMNVAKSLIEITAGEADTDKTIWVKIPYADLVTRLKKVDELPQASLF